MGIISFLHNLIGKDEVCFSLFLCPLWSVFVYMILPVYNHYFFLVCVCAGRGSPAAPPSSGSSGFSDDDSLHFDDGRGFTLEEFVRHLRDKGRQGLYHEYSQIKSRPPDGTFENSRYTRMNVYLPVSLSADAH